MVHVHQLVERFHRLLWVPLHVLGDDLEPHRAAAGVDHIRADLGALNGPLPDLRAQAGQAAHDADLVCRLRIGVSRAGHQAKPSKADDRDK